MPALKVKKILRIISILLFLTLVILGLVFYQSQRPQKLEVIFFDVEEGDSIFIKTPYRQNILIDGGMNKIVMNKLGKNLPFWDRKIDLMILTHPHADHVIGLVEVLKRYKVKQVFSNGVFYLESNYNQWQKLLKEKNIPSQIITAGHITELGKDLELITFWPFEKTLVDYQKDKLNLNNTSIVSKLIYKNTSFLFMGDLEWDKEEELLDSKFAPELKADVLKIGHHGSISSSTKKFLEAVQPKWAVITAGKDNKVNHPSPRVIKRLERMDIKYFRIDQNGDVKMTSDGEHFQIDLEAGG